MLIEIENRLIKRLESIRFGLPVTHVYNPLEYARQPHRIYLERFGRPEKEVVLVGMNPGPWGMAQTGIPFGDVEMVKNWMGIEAPVGTPATVHPKRPVNGFACARCEVSGRRLWGWAKKRFETPDKFFSRFFIANYCPLVFMEEKGRNRTPDKIRPKERTPLIEACDIALIELVDYLKPRFVVGIGKFAAQRISQALAGFKIQTGCILHPSPANPKANKDWEKIVTRELIEIGIFINDSAI